MIVAQARSPAFYRDYGVPDTVDGRLDMIMLHLVLLMRRLAGPTRGKRLPAAGQELFDRFCRDIDDNFREMGVGDLTVPKEMRHVAEAFYGRAKAYESALAADDTAALEAALARNVFGVAAPPLGARRLAAYMREASRRLDAQSRWLRWRGRQLDFPDPERRHCMTIIRAKSRPRLEFSGRGRGHSRDRAACRFRRRTRGRATPRQDRGLQALPRLEAGFDLTRHGADGLRLVGRVAGDRGADLRGDA